MLGCSGLARAVVSSMLHQEESVRFFDGQKGP